MADACTAVRRALEARLAEWHPGPGGAPDIARAARIAVEAADPFLGRYGSSRGASAQHVDRLERTVARLEALAGVVAHATIRDHAIYEEVADESWLGIDRDDVALIFSALAEVDRWKPWRTPFERRLGDV